MTAKGNSSLSFNIIDSKNSSIEILEFRLNDRSFQDVNVELEEMPELCNDSPLLIIPLDNVVESPMKSNQVINEFSNQIEGEIQIEN